MDMKEALNRIASNLDLSTEEMKDVMRIVMKGEATDAQIGAFLMGLRIKSETIDEITGATEVMRELATRVTVNADPDDPRIDDVGGDFLPGWGLHIIDMNLAIDDLVAVVAQQADKAVKLHIVIQVGPFGTGTGSRSIAAEYIAVIKEHVRFDLIHIALQAAGRNGEAVLISIADGIRVKGTPGS